MARSATELLDWMTTEPLVRRYLTESDERGVAAVRGHVVRKIVDFIGQNTLPDSDEDLYQLNLVPFLFQEANYDDLDWTTQAGCLGHLKPLFELDFMVQNRGLERSEATAEQYAAYTQRCRQYIQRRNREG